MAATPKRKVARQGKVRETAKRIAYARGIAKKNILASKNKHLRRLTKKQRKELA